MDVVRSSGRQDQEGRAAPAPEIRPGGGLRSWWHGRYGYAMAFEIVLVLVLLSFYRYTRYLAREHTGAAFANAHHVLGFEHQLGIDSEQNLQQAALHHLWLVKALNRYYVSVHFPATIGFLVYLYVRAPDAYRFVRRLFVAVTGVALAIHVLYPLAPPRMMPGYVDTVSLYGPSIYQRSDVSSTANQFAAMPSLHFGWAVLVAYGIVRFGHGRWRSAIVAHPVVILLAIVITANHYWLDAIVAGLIVAAATAVAHTREEPALRPASHSDPMAVT